MSVDEYGLEAAKRDTSEAVSRVLGRGSFYTVATSIQLGAGILAIPILTRTLSPEEFGTITAALVVQAVLGTVAAFGLPAAISRAYFHDDGPGGARALIATTLASALALALVAELTGPLWSTIFENLPYGDVLRLAVISSVPTAVLISAQTVLRSADRAGLFVITAAMATAGAQALGALFAGAGAAGYMAGVTVGLAAAMAVAWVGAGIELAPLRRASGGGGLLRRAALIGLPTIPHGLALYLLSAADRIVVERIDGLASAGAYYASYAVGSLAIFLVAALNSAWGPILYGSAEEVRWSFLADSATEFGRVIGFAVAMLALGAPIALAAFAPNAYDLDGLGSVSALVAASALPYLGYAAISNVVIWQGRTSILAWTTPVIAAVNIALCALLIPAIGLVGAALATLISYVLLAWLTWACSRRLAEIPWAPRPLAHAMFPGVVGVILALVLPEQDAWLVIRGMLAALAGLAALAVLATHRRPSPISESP